MKSVPFNEPILIAVAKLIDDSLLDIKREPSHSEIDFLFTKVKLEHADPKAQGRSVGKLNVFEPFFIGRLKMTFRLERSLLSA